MRYILYLSIILLFFSCKNNNKENKKILTYYASDTKNNDIIDEVECCDSINGANIFLSSRKFNFGKVKQKEVDSIKVNFEVKNIGNKPLIITKCDVSCSVCFTVDFSKKPILPNQKSMITANIDTKNQSGAFNKTIFVKSNAKDDVVLMRIVGEIK